MSIFSFLSVSNNLDTLALSTSSSSISSSTSSLFGHETRLSNSSQTDISPPVSPMKEDAESRNGEDCMAVNSGKGQYWHPVAKTPRQNACSILSPASLQYDRPDGPPQVERSHSTEDSGYQAEASDGDEDISSFFTRTRKKLLTKRGLSLKTNSQDPDIALTTEDILTGEAKPGSQLPQTLVTEGHVFLDTPASPLAQRRSILPMKPMLRAQVGLDLNSPSPIVALPSPRAFNHFRRQQYGLGSLSGSLSPVDSLPSPEFISRYVFEQLQPRLNVSSNVSQKPLGLGLNVPVIHSLGHSISTVSTPLGSSPKQEKKLVGLGIKLPSSSPSEHLTPSSSPQPAPVYSSVAKKRHSLSGLGLGLPSTLRGPSTQRGDPVPASEATVRLVTPIKSENDHDSAQESIVPPPIVSPDFDPSGQRRVSVCFSPIKASQFPKRHLYTIPESPSSPVLSRSPRIRSRAPSPFSPKSTPRSRFRSENENDCVQAGFGASIASMAMTTAQDCSPCSPSLGITRSPLLEKRSSMVVDHGLGEVRGWQPPPMDQYLPMAALTANTLF